MYKSEGSGGEFKTNLEIYGLIFRALSKVIAYFQVKLSRDSQVSLEDEDLVTLYELSEACYNVLTKIKKIVLAEGSEVDESAARVPYDSHKTQETSIQN